MLRVETSTSAHQDHHEYFQPSTPPLHRVGPSPAPSWLVAPQAFLLDTSKNSPWLLTNAQTNPAGIGIAGASVEFIVENGRACGNVTPVSTDWE